MQCIQMQKIVWLDFLLFNLDLQFMVLFAFVSKMFLEQQWSPEEIAGRLAYECSNLKISFNTIYRTIYAGMFDTPHERRSRGHRGAIRKLRHKGKTRHKKGR